MIHEMRPASTDPTQVAGVYLACVRIIEPNSNLSTDSGHSKFWGKTIKRQEMNSSFCYEINQHANSSSNQN